MNTTTSKPKETKGAGGKKLRNKDNFKQELNDRQKQNIKEAFDLFDVDGSGKFFIIFFFNFLRNY